MKYEQFASKLEMIQLNLKMVIEQKDKQSEAILIEASKELLDNKEYALVFLASLETQLHDHHVEKQYHISQLTNEIVLLKEKLENELSEYQKTHVVNDDKTRLLTTKEEKLVEPHARKKKEIQEINQKITLLDKECLQILKENETALWEEEKNYKQKLVELERKMKFEVQRIGDAILTPTSDDLEQEGVMDKKKSIETRKEGINEIAKIRLKYYNEMRQIEIAFCNYKYQLKRDRGILREEYDQKIEELNFARKNHQIDLQKQIDMYDFDVYKNVNTYEKKYRLEENDINIDHLDKLSAIHANSAIVEKVKEDIEHLDMIAIYDQINDYDSSQISLHHRYIQTQQQIAREMTDKTNEFLIDILNTYQNIMIAIIHHFWDAVYHHEQQLYDALVFLNYQTKLSSDFSYVPFEQELHQLFDDFTKQQKNRTSELIQEFNNHHKILLRQVLNVYNFMIDYLDSEQKKLQEHQAELQSWVMRVHEKAMDHLNTNYEKALQNIQTNQSRLAEEQKASHDVMIAQSRAIEDDYFSKSKHLNDKIDAYSITLKNNAHRAKQDHQIFIAKSKTNINQFKSNYKVELQEELSRIAHKYDMLVREAGIERKTKLKMGQI
ncbi:MAG: hypothetical protein WCT17_02905 [Bacilli bacterium]